MEPGFLRTDFLDPAGLHTGPDTVDDYPPTVGAMPTAAVSLNHARPGDPVKAARIERSAVMRALAGSGMRPRRSTTVPTWAVCLRISAHPARGLCVGHGANSE
ncbi:hypothetical protein AB0D59_15605 [Streptomyces sp. NPDC048417]|uniref:hypothetical protein n=1 Tax=Streptomyces sp. NPDC048417 TaxID=3155387 RepID=UPI00344AE7F4